MGDFGHMHERTHMHARTNVLKILKTLLWSLPKRFECLEVLRQAGHNNNFFTCKTFYCQRITPATVVIADTRLSSQHNELHRGIPVASGIDSRLT